MGFPWNGPSLFVPPHTQVEIKGRTNAGYGQMADLYLDDAPPNSHAWGYPWIRHTAGFSVMTEGPWSIPRWITPVGWYNQGGHWLLSEVKANIEPENSSWFFDNGLFDGDNDFDDLIIDIRRSPPATAAHDHRVADKDMLEPADEEGEKTASKGDDKE